MACARGDTICADCFNERHKVPNAKCPTCGDSLQPSAIVNKKLLELIESYASVPDIPEGEMEVDRTKPIFEEKMKYKIYDTKWRGQNVVVKVKHLTSLNAW